MSFLAALRFLTIVRLPGRQEPTPTQFGRSLAYFPLVGLLIGLSLALLSWLFGLGLPPSITAALLVAWLAIVSGGMHLDGLADTCDGIGGQKSPEARLEVMRDSRVGGFGVIGVALVLIAKYAAIISIPSPLLLAPAPVISRWAMLYALYAYPYARPTGLGKLFKEQVNSGIFALGTILTIALVMLLFGWGKGTESYLAGVVILAAAWAIIAGLAVYLRRKLGGLTGDTYGAINEVAEVVALILTSLLAYNRWLGLG